MIITTFSEFENEIRSVRDAVFGLEQGVPRELDWDGEDMHCAHVLARGPDGSPIGTGRMRPDGKIGRLAVLAHWRGNGVGGKMLAALVSEASARGLERVYLHAQFQAIAFYERHGFSRQGGEFFEAGLLHVKMIKNLKA